MSPFFTRSSEKERLRLEKLCPLSLFERTFKLSRNVSSVLGALWGLFILLSVTGLFPSLGLGLTLRVLRLTTDHGRLTVCGRPGPTPVNGRSVVVETETSRPRCPLSPRTQKSPGRTAYTRTDLW